MKRMRWIVGLVVACTLVLFALPVVAQNDTPQADAERIRQQLFSAQSKLLLGDQAAAVKAMADADTLYQASLEPIFSKAVPDIATSLDKAFTQASKAVDAHNQVTLAIVRGAIWTSFLNASSQLAIQAVQANDGQRAGEWLLLREFTASTKFSRPNADATKAVQAFAAGMANADDTITAIQNDLLDSYQAQLTSSLANADDARHNGFTLRQAEEVGLAAGYFTIIGSKYGEQRGATSLRQTASAFDALSQVTATGDQNEYENVMSLINAGLKGFRAAPLSEKDQTRRAGQLIRFVDLVSMEYKRGIRNGVVVKGIEIQEANTFLEASTAAFNDISLTLEKVDADKTNQVASLLSEMKTQIETTADPAALEANGNSIQGLLKAVLPAQWQQVANASDMDVVLSVLDQIPVAIKENQYDLAESARLEAYGLMELGMEQRLRGFAPDMANNIEGLFWQGGSAPTASNGTDSQTTLRGLADLVATRASIEEVKITLGAIRTALANGQAIIDAGKSTPTIVISNSAIIVFREGLEAVLILASLLASLRTLEERKFRRPIVMGAALAFVATGLTWWAANALLQTMLPLGERLEAIVSLIAIGVLLVITNWFFHKVYWTGWMAGFHSKKRTLIGGVAAITIGQTLGLIILGFTSVYREGFESVLFMQSLVLEAGLGIVLQGVVLGLVGVAIVGMITFTLQRKLPYKKMLVVTGVMIGFVLLTMVGNTVHVLQVVGWLPITPIIGLNLPLWLGQWLGLFATWQGIVLQGAAGAFVIGSYFLAERLNHRRKANADEQRKGVSQATLETRVS